MISLIRSFRVKLRRKQQFERLRAVATLGANVAIAPGFRLTNKAESERPLRIGSQVLLDGAWCVRGAGVITVGSYCSFRCGTYIGALFGVEIGNHVFGAEQVYICDNNNHPTSPRLRREMTLSPPDSAIWKWDKDRVVGAPIIIEDCVWLGRYSMILKGVRIGRGSIVGAGAVVTRSVPPFSVVVGNPARVVKTLHNDLDDD